MTLLFNEFGIPNQSIINTTEKIENIIIGFFKQLEEKRKNGLNFPISDYRAIGCYFIQSINCCVSAVVMDAAHNIRKETKKSADPNLNSEEINLIKEGKKIIAIQHYHERTTFELKECKDAIEKWMLDKLETKII